MPKEKSIIIIPTYNESENIVKIIHEIFSLNANFRILVVDDNSPDNTSNCVKKIMRNYEQKLFLLSRKKKTGLGPAYIDGFKGLDLGSAGAQSILMMIIVLVITIFQFRYIEGKIHYN